MPASAFRHPLFQSGTGPKMPDCVGLVRYRVGPGVVSFYHSGTGLIGYRTIRHSGIFSHAHTQEHAHEHPLRTRTQTPPRTRTRTPPRTCTLPRTPPRTHTHTQTLTRTSGLDIDMDMQHGNRHAPWTRTSSMDARMPMKSLVWHR
jgi:hypothetical protein